MFLPILLVIGLVVYLLWDHPKHGRLTMAGHKQDEAIELLKRRYIRGEIDEETYFKIIITE
jgi:uncharacterized membrane protein